MADVPVINNVCIALFFVYTFFVLIPYHLKWNYILFKARNSAAIYTRCYPLIALVNLCILIFMLIDRPIMAFFAGGHMIEDNNSSMYSVFEWIESISFHISVDGAFLFTLQRIYLLYFNVSWNEASTDQSWAYHINPTANDNWFLRCRKTFGTPFWLFTRVFVPFFLFIEMVMYVVKLWASGYFYLVQGVFLGSVVAGTTILWQKTPVYADEFCVHIEIRNSLYVGFMLIILYVMWAVLVAADMDYFLLWTVLNVCNMTAALTMVWMGSQYVLLKNRALQNQLQSEHSMGSHSTIEHGKLRDTLINHQSFTAFMQQLFREFSSEHLLCVTELTQFQMWCIDTIDGCGYAKLIQLPNDASFPQSAIVYNNDDASEPLSKRAANRIMRLCQKYIVVGSEFEVNIIGRDRVELTDLMKRDVDGLSQMEAKDLTHVFDTTIAKCFELLQGSYYRWDAYGDMEVIMAASVNRL